MPCYKFKISLSCLGINSAESSPFEMVGTPEHNKTDDENGEEINLEQESNSPAYEKVN